MSDNIIKFQRPKPVKPPRKSPFKNMAPGVKRSRTADDQLIAELQAHVRGQLAPYEYPKEIEFIDELPMTTTGKVLRRVLRDLEQERYQESMAE